MERESGKPTAKVWLLGDSEPAHWRDRLSVPLDSRHPARHNIWTSVLEVAQRLVFERAKSRFDDGKGLFVRNAVADPSVKPRDSDLRWAEPVQAELRTFAELIAVHRPLLVLTFGAFACEFSRRSLGQVPAWRTTAEPTPPSVRAYRSWGARELGSEFRGAVASFNTKRTTLLPLLHVSISRGRFLESHRDFCGVEGANYFEEVGAHLGELLLRGSDAGVCFLR